MSSSTISAIPSAATVKRWSAAELYQYARSRPATLSPQAWEAFKQADIRGDLFLRLGSGDTTFGGYTSAGLSVGASHRLLCWAHEIRGSSAATESAASPLPHRDTVRRWSAAELCRYLATRAAWPAQTWAEFRQAEIDGELFVLMGAADATLDAYRPALASFGARLELRYWAKDIRDASPPEAGLPAENPAPATLRIPREPMRVFGSRGGVPGQRAKRDTESRGPSPEMEQPEPKRTCTMPGEYSRHLCNAQILHSTLWGKDGDVRGVIFQTRTVRVHRFGVEDTSEEVNCTHLDLTPLVDQYISTVTGVEVAKRVLPCLTNSMLVRKAYVEAWNYINAREKHRPKERGSEVVTNPDGTRTVRSGVILDNSRPVDDKAVIISGNPGIGKTWFLSYVLVERLLNALPTIVQYAATESEAGHILFDKHGVRFVPFFTEEVACNSSIWVLCDRKPIGLSRRTDEHDWFLLIATSPNAANTKAIEKHNQAETLYMALWSWEEMVCTGRFLKKSDLRTMYNLFTMFGPIPGLIINTLMGARNTDDSESASDDSDTGDGLADIKDDAEADADGNAEDLEDDSQAVLSDENAEYWKEDAVTLQATSKRGSDARGIRVRTLLGELQSKAIELLRHGLSAHVENHFDLAESHSLIRIDPVPHKGYRFISPEYTLRVMNAYLGRMIGMNAAARASIEDRTLCRNPPGSLKMRSGLGWGFEGRVHE